MLRSEDGKKDDRDILCAIFIFREAQRGEKTRKNFYTSCMIHNVLKFFINKLLILKGPNCYTVTLPGHWFVDST